MTEDEQGKEEARETTGRELVVLDTDDDFDDEDVREFEEMLREVEELRGDNSIIEHMDPAEFKRRRKEEFDA
jgi:hypothetical protein